MDDKLIMETLLNNVKGACDLMMHGSIESPTPNVRSTFTATRQRAGIRPSAPRSIRSTQSRDSTPETK